MKLSIQKYIKVNVDRDIENIYVSSFHITLIPGYYAMQMPDDIREHD